MGNGRMYIIQEIERLPSTVRSTLRAPFWQILSGCLAILFGIVTNSSHSARFSETQNMG